MKETLRVVVEYLPSVRPRFAGPTTLSVPPGCR
jgi:hypothetical protein